METGQVPYPASLLRNLLVASPHPAVPPRWPQHSAAHTRTPLLSTHYTSSHCRKVAQATWNTPDSYHFSFWWLAKVPPAQGALEPLLLASVLTTLPEHPVCGAAQDPPACTMPQIQSRCPTTVPSMWRASGHPGLHPLHLQPFHQGSAITEYPGNPAHTNHSSSQPKLPGPHHLHRGWLYTRPFLWVSK